MSNNMTTAGLESSYGIMRWENLNSGANKLSHGVGMREANTGHLPLRPLPVNWLPGKILWKGR